MKNKQKLIAIINDLKADNFFNTDDESGKNIQISIDLLQSELGITEIELQKDLESR